MEETCVVKVKEWGYDEEIGWYVCPECGAEMILPWNHCPDCGTKMRNAEMHRIPVKRKEN